MIRRQQCKRCNLESLLTAGVIMSSIINDRRSALWAARWGLRGLGRGALTRIWSCVLSMPRELRCTVQPALRLPFLSRKQGAHVCTTSILHGQRQDHVQGLITVNFKTVQNKRKQAMESIKVTQPMSM